MNAPGAFHRTALRQLGGLLLWLLVGTSFFAQAAAAGGLAARRTNAAVAAPAAAPASAPVSPHVRAARERAAAQAATGPSGVRVSAFTTRRKPHNRMGAR